MIHAMSGQSFLAHGQSVKERIPFLNEIVQSDSRTLLRQIPDESVDAVINRLSRLCSPKP